MASIIRRASSKPTETIDAQQAATIRFVSENIYAETNNAGKANKLAGQTYYRCEYAGIVFNTRDAEFVAAVRDKSLFSATFAVEEVAAGVAADGTQTSAPRQYLELIGYQVFETETRRNIAETSLLEAQAAKFEAALRLRMAQRAGAQAASAVPVAATASAATVPAAASVAATTVGVA
jgi:hypothetical protein